MQHLLNYQDWINESLTEWQLVTEDEGWGDWISTSLHLVGDLAAAVADCIVPASGSVIDAVNAIAYFIESKFEEDENRKNMLIISGLIQIAAIFIIGPLGAGLIIIKNAVKDFFILVKNSRLLATMASKIIPITTAIKGIIRVFSDIVTTIISYLTPPSKFAQVLIYISEKLKIPNAIRWLNNFLLNTVQPVLKNFLEKLESIIPPKIKQIILASGQHEAEELALKNLLKSLTKGYTGNKISDTLAVIANDRSKHKLTVNRFELENQTWWANKLAVAPTSGLTPVPAPVTTSQQTFNYDFLNNH